MGSINEHDVMFLREVLVYKPCKHKYGSQEWWKYWEKFQNLWMVWRVSMNYNLKWPNNLCETSISFLQTILKSAFSQQETGRRTPQVLCPKKGPTETRPSQICLRFSNKSIIDPEIHLTPVIDPEIHLALCNKPNGTPSTMLKGQCCK